MISISTEEINDVIVIHIKGILTIEHIKEAEEVWLEQLEKRPKILAFELSEITEVDSVAINHIIKLVRAAAEMDVKLIICDTNEQLEKIFKVIKLDRVITIMPNKKFQDEYIRRI